MSGKELIDLLFEKWLSFGQGVTSQKADFRALLLHYAQKAVNDLWFKYNWTWVYNEADVLVSAGLNEVEGFPTDYHSCNKDGQVYLTTSPIYNLNWMPPLRLMQLLKRGTTPSISTRRAPLAYTEFMGNTNVLGTYTSGRRMFVWPVPVTNTNMRIVYKVKPPIIQDLEDLPPISTVSSQRDTNVVTIETDGDHGLIAGQQVSLSGMVDGGMDDFWTVASAPTTSSFTFDMAGADTAVVPEPNGLVVSQQSNLAAIPDEYHETILVDKCISLIMDKEGDGRSAAYEAKYLKAAAEAWADEMQGINTKRRWGNRYGSRSNAGGPWPMGAFLGGFYW